MLSWMSGIINPNPWRLCVHVRCIVVRKREQARASARECLCGGAIPRGLCVFLFLPSRHSFFLRRARHSHGEGTCLLFRDRQEGQRFVVFSSSPLISLSSSRLLLFLLQSALPFFRSKTLFHLLVYNSCLFVCACAFVIRFCLPTASRLILFHSRKFGRSKEE